MAAVPLTGNPAPKADSSAPYTPVGQEPAVAVEVCDVGDCIVDCGEGLEDAVCMNGGGEASMSPTASNGVTEDSCTAEVPVGISSDGAPVPSVAEHDHVMRPVGMPVAASSDAVPVPAVAEQQHTIRAASRPTGAFPQQPEPDMMTLLPPARTVLETHVLGEVASKPWMRGGGGPTRIPAPVYSSSSDEEAEGLLIYNSVP